MGNLPRRSARQFAPLNHAGAPPHYQGQHPKGREAQRRPLKSTSLTPETLVRPQAVTFKGKTPTATEHLPPPIRAFGTMLRKQASEPYRYIPLHAEEPMQGDPPRCGPPRVLPKLVWILRTRWTRLRKPPQSFSCGCQDDAPQGSHQSGSRCQSHHKSQDRIRGTDPR